MVLCLQMLSLKSHLNIFLISIFLSACSAKKDVIEPKDAYITPSHQPPSLEKVYTKYKGTPYCYGGTTPKCLDCSAFVQKAYQEAFHITLPRTTHQQITIGHHIKQTQLHLGDLLFFQTASKTLHSAIYLKNGEFIHASSSHGVTKSSLQNRYWKKAYIEARRVSLP